LTCHAGREELGKPLEVGRAQEDDVEMKKIRRGWCLGGETFRQELLEQAPQTTFFRPVSLLRSWRSRSISAMMGIWEMAKEWKS
jgi:hypothetical protein